MKRESEAEDSLFSDGPDAGSARVALPLAARMRPETLAEVVGQDHLTGPDALLPRLMDHGQFGCLIFYGPPGCGKTTLAEVIARQTKTRFQRINAVLSNVAELREQLKMARYHLTVSGGGPTVLFIDEIHRFNRAQQDLLLPDMESGAIRLIGATTQNPGFFINAPLLSRSHLFRLEPIREEAVAQVLHRASTDLERGLGARQHAIDEAVFAAIARYANGDLRRGLNALETLLISHPIGAVIAADAFESFAAERRIRYDRNEDEHYDHASALIKSVRGGDPDAALYWMFKMLEGGEDPRFIARRLVILASEDIGLANSNGLLLATSAFQACEQVGLPECEYALAHAAVYLACSPKSNSVTLARQRVKADIAKEPPQTVPLWLRDGHGSANRQAGNAAEYRYSHDYPEAVSGQEYLNQPKRFFEAGSSGAEASIRERLEHWRTLRKRIQAEAGEGAR